MTAVGDELFFPAGDSRILVFDHDGNRTEISTPATRINLVVPSPDKCYLVIGTNVPDGGCQGDGSGIDRIFMIERATGAVLWERDKPFGFGSGGESEVHWPAGNSVYLSLPRATHLRGRWVDWQELVEPRSGTTIGGLP